MFSPLTEVLKNMRIILATGSKQRAEILSKTCLQFEVKTSNFDENIDASNHSVEEYVQLTALGKVEKVYEELKSDQRPPDLIIGLDTMVVCGKEMYGKPKDTNEAIEIIRKLTSCEDPHVIFTGVVIYHKGNYVKFVEATKVYMEKLTEEEILAYVATGEPIGKAGAYAIQGLAASFVKLIEGDYNNVIGLPLCRLTTELKKILLNK